MQFVGFRIRNYKVIHDTGYVKVDPRVTTFVGKNESGKTSIFTALWKSLNVADVSFDRLYDYPRGLYSRDRFQPREVALLEFRLSDEDVEGLLAELPRKPAQTPRFVTCTASYDGEHGVRTQLAFSPKLAAPPFSTRAHDALAAAATIAHADAEAPEEVRHAHAAVQDAADRGLLETEGVAELGAFLEAIDRWLETNPARAGAVTEQRARLADFLAEAAESDLEEEAHAWARATLPRFIYFSDYDRLEGRIHLPSYLNRRRNADPASRTQAVLFEWSGLDPEEILSLSRRRDDEETDDAFLRRREVRDTLLDTAAFTLSGDWATWWREKQHRLHFTMEDEDLVLKVSDLHNSFPVPFEERSKGFQWFFSFYLVFLAESKRTRGGAILLLDEPGLHLHPNLQSELISLFERIADDNQVLYSTHLPFLIDANRMERIRTVHLTGAEPRTTRVSKEIRPADHRDTLSPLQCALGPAAVQTLLLGKRLVIVEGVTDFWILQALNHALQAADGVTLLHRDSVLVPAGGRSRLIPLVFVILAASGQHRAVVLLNSSREGEEEAARLRDVFGDDVPLLMVGDLLEQPGATVEDLVPREVYAEVAQQGRLEVPLSENEQAAPTNVEAIAQLFRRMGFGEFSRAEQAKVALALTDRWNRDRSTIPEATMEHALLLAEALNRSLELRIDVPKLPERIDDLAG
ncbi:MAG: AAA family ATPase [Gammaproteobacteria bacterium]|nr:AAA family ATPase [Gammaproteobacteria bacterium]